MSKKKVKKQQTPPASKKKYDKPAYTAQQKKLIAMQKAAPLSKPEQEIRDFLVANNITFYRNFYFSEMKRNGRPKLLFYDFFLPEYKVCIEYDGELHYKNIESRGNFEQQQQNDFFKTAFCR